MSDRTQLAIGRNSISVPKMTKRALQVVYAVIITAAISLVIIMLNNVLTTKGGWMQGVAAWTAFIQRSDILGTMILTALITVATLYWPRGHGK
jgi:hypothetical protein